MNNKTKNFSKIGFFEKFFDLLADALCSLLITFGAMVLLNPLFDERISNFGLFFISLICVFAVVLLSRKIIISLSAFGVALILGTVYLAAKKSFGIAYEKLLRFFLWWFKDGMYDGSDRYFSGAFELSYFLVCAVIAIFAFLFIRKLRKAWILFIAVSISLPIINDFSNAKSAISGTIFLLVGLLSTIAKEQYAKKRIFSRKEKIKPITPRSLVSLTAAVLCVVVATGVVTLLPENVNDWHTRFCSDTIVDIQSATGVYSEQIREYESYSFVDAGIQMDKNHLGGNLTNSEKVVLGEVIADKSYLLKASTFEHFNGSRWSNFEDVDYYRIDGPYSKKFDKYFSSKGYTMIDGESPISRLVPTKEITVKLTRPATTLFSTSQSIGFSEKNKTKTPIVFNDRAEIIALFGIEKGYEYNIRLYDFPMTVEALEGNTKLKQYAEDVTDNDDEIYDNADFYYRYTQLPKYWSNILSDESQKIVEDTKSLYEAALKLSNYFTDVGGYTYTKNPGELNKKHTLVDSLIATKKGYSVHYATAMCLMARNVGIPSRVVLGYKTVESEEGGKWLITSDNAYVWVECYFSNLGWVPFDAAPYENSKSNIGDADSDGEFVPNEIIFQQPQIPDDDVVEEEPEEEIREDFEIPKGVIITIVVILLFVLSMYVRAKISVKFYRYERVKKKFKNSRKAAEFYYKDLLRQLKYLQVNYKPSDTFEEIFEKLSKDLSDASVQDTFNILNAVLYGEYVPNDNDLLLICANREKFEQKLKTELSKNKYRLLRMVLLPGK